MGTLNLGAAGILQADKWENSDGTENYKCRAWVNFNGTGTVAIRAAGNVSSITDNGVGDYTVNFATAMPDANFSPVAVAGSTTISGPAGGSRLVSAGAATASSVRLTAVVSSNSASTDFDYICLAFFR